MHLVLLAFSVLGLFSGILPMLGAAAGLGFVIFVHELGHFLVAKACGVKCEKFYLGFDVGGWKIWHHKWGETEYGIGAIPLGGYVKMLGQDDDPRKAAEERERSLATADAAASAGAVGADAAGLSAGGVATAVADPLSGDSAAYDPRSYMAKSVPQRIAIISAGVIMNLIFAVIFATIAYMLGVRYAPTVIGGVTPGDPAWVADIHPGDKIVGIGQDAGVDERLRFTQDLLPRVMFTGGSGQLELAIRRAGTNKIEHLTLRPTEANGAGQSRAVIGVAQSTSLTLASEHPVLPDTPAAKAGFEKNDKIVAAVIDGREYAIDDYVQLQRLLVENYDKPVAIVVERTLNSGDAAGAKADDSPKTKRVRLTLEPQVGHDLGVVMELGPIVAIQEGSPAKEAGFKVGDEIVSIDGRRDLNPMQISSDLRKLVGQEVAIEVRRKVDGKETVESLKVTPRAPQYIEPVALDHPVASQEIGIAYRVLNTVGRISSGASDEAKKLHPGDRIDAVRFLPANDEQQTQYEDLGIKKGKEDLLEFRPDANKPEQYDWPFVISVIQGTEGLPPGAIVHIEFSRGDKKYFVDVPSKIDEGRYVASLRGLRLQALSDVRPPAPLPEAFALGLRETQDSIWQVTTILRKLVGGGVSVYNLGGIGTIAVQATMSASDGISTLLLFLTLLSANLAVLNILPIPVLDGGHLVLLLYEGIRGKPANERVVVAVTYAGLIFILTLMIFVLGLDITRFFNWLTH